VTPRVLVEAVIQEYHHQGGRIIDVDDDPRSDDKCQFEGDGPKHRESSTDHDEHTAKIKNSHEEMMEPQLQMMDLLLQHNTEQPE
jgi:hypothetical protein